jgi:hypothetical protein
MSVWWFKNAPFCLFECHACRMAGTSPVPCSSSNPDRSSARLICSSLVTKRFSYTSSLRRRLLSPSLQRRLDPLDIGMTLSSNDCIWIKVMAICGPLGTSICVLGRVGCLVMGTQPSSCIWDDVLCVVCRLLTFFPSLALSFMYERLLCMTSLWCCCPLCLTTLTSRCTFRRTFSSSMMDDCSWLEGTAVWGPIDKFSPGLMFVFELLLLMGWILELNVGWCGSKPVSWPLFV